MSLFQLFSVTCSDIERIFRQMRPFSTQLFAIAFFVLFAPTDALAQRFSAQFIESIEVRALNSETVAIGKLVTVRDKERGVEAVFAVEETLKGDRESIRRVHLQAFGDARDITRIFKENKEARLLFMAGSFTILDSKSPEFRLLGNKTVRGDDEVIPYLREVIRSHPQWNKTQTFTVDGLIVPIDGRLEQWAIGAIASKELRDDRRYEAVRALQFFKSEANISLMKSLLDDTTARTVNIANVSRRNYYIRQAAYEALKKWGVEVNEPLLNEELPKSLPR